MKSAIYGVEIAISIAMIVLLLLQLRGGGLSGVFGGGGGGSSYRSRRGIERILFRVTIVLAALFVIVAALSLLVK